ncbi:MAG: tagaturonate epimerase family protein [Salinivirgaceae bacterium]
MLIEKYSFGTGDRFGKEGRAQLAAIQEINKVGFNVVPVWNKSNREHSIVHTTPDDVATEAAEAVKANSYSGNYYIDADHIGMATVDKFINASNFFTIDVAHFIGQSADATERAAFVMNHSKYLGKFSIPGIEQSFDVTETFLAKVANNYLNALKEVKTIYDHIASKKGAADFIPEVSMDECEIAQTPLELFFILAELKRLGVEVQTIAPKFTGLFAKGVDYQGNVEQFALEFEQDVAVTQFAIKELGLPSSLKLSVHSGSDKFAIYPAMKKAIKKFDAGIHVKTAGTTWLEEVIGLAQGGGEGLAIAKEIYAKSMERYDELTGPYATVLNIEKEKLPSVNEVNAWTSQQFSDALTHNQSCSDYNPSFRQVIHVGYKIAVEMGSRYITALDTYREVIEGHVKHNLLERHLKLLFN